MKTIANLILITIFIYPFTAIAHLRWFTEDQTESKTKFEFDHIYFSLIILAIGYCLTCLFIELKSKKNITLSKIMNKGITFNGFEWEILKGSIVLMLILNIIHGVYIAPNLDPTIIGKDLCILIQALIIVCSTIHNLLLFSSIIFCLSLTLINFGFNLSIDYIPEFLAIALCFFAIELNRFRDFKLLRNFKRHINQDLPCRILRLFFGIQLVVLAIHNKFLNPDLGLLFLRDYPFVNFVKGIGLHFFDDIYFVFSAGLAELCFGLLLILNISTRFVSLCVIFFFSVTSIIFGIHELTGHLPIIFGLIIVFLHSNNGKGIKNTEISEWSPNNYSLSKSST